MSTQAWAWHPTGPRLIGVGPRGLKPAARYVPLKHWRLENELMSSNERCREDLLLDLHLDRAGDEQRRWIEEELRRDADLRAKSDRLGQLLRPLDHWAAAPPHNLAENVLEAIGKCAQRSKKDRRWSFARGGYRPAPFLSPRELIAVAASIAVLVVLSVPGLAVMRERSQQVLCAGNLGAIFQGTSLYQAAHAGSLPFAGHLAGASWLPNEPSGGPYASNSRHPFLLVKLNYGPKSEQFLCSSGPGTKPMSPEQLAALTDFADPAHISYDSLNLASATPNLRPRTAIAYMGDRNPLFVGGRFHAAVDPATTNSPAHGGKCQSVLLLDGRVVKLRTPIYGIQRDNLWLAGDIRHYTGTETPTSDDDAFLVPGCPKAGGTTQAVQH